MTISAETCETDYHAAQAAFRQGDTARAIALCEKVLVDCPGFADASYLLGLIALNGGNAADAVACFRAAVKAAPESALFHHSLAAASYKNGDFQQAETSFRQAIRLTPDQLDIRLKLAGLLRLQDRPEDALREYTQVTRLAPDNLEALFISCQLYRQLGNGHQALAGYQRLYALQPQNPEIPNAIGAMYHETGDFPAAVEYYRKAIALRPDYVEAYNNLGSALSRLDRVEEAVAGYEHAIRIDGTHPSWQLRIASLCPSVPASIEEIDEYRNGLLERLNRFADAGFRASPEELVQVGAYPPYALMYHGRDDRSLREAYARVYQPSFPVQVDSLRASGRRRICMLVTRTHEEIFARSMAGVLRHVDAAQFELVIACAAGREQVMQRLLANPAVGIMPVPEAISALAQFLRQGGFDILYHWEIATDPLNYFLPFYRLAPVQCTSWGIQVTSGIPTVDYYLSSDLVEPEHGASSYTEQLLCSDTLLTFQYRSELAARPRQRSDFGFDDRVNLYLFPQQIGKFHPDFDIYVASILRYDPAGRLLILQDRWPRSSERLRRRLARTASDVIDRIVFLPRLSHEDYLSLVAVSDVLLDPPHYGGVNSSYDGFSLNVPIVTMESGYHIGRYTAGCYRKMGMADCIPGNREDYVAMAVRLGTEVDSREEFSERLRNASDVLFEDYRAVREHERLFNTLLDSIAT